MQRCNGGVRTNRSINSVPGVITLESKGLVVRGAGKVLPSSSSSSRRRAMSFFLSALSMAARNRLERCWFIFARGACDRWLNRTTSWHMHNYIMKRMSAQKTATHGCDRLCRNACWSDDADQHHPSSRCRLVDRRTGGPVCRSLFYLPGRPLRGKAASLDEQEQKSDQCTCKW